jgi:lauroyl/myristoyl acyltransferase
VHWHKEFRYWFEWLGVALCARIIPLLLLALLRLLAYLAGWLAFQLDSKGRAVALANLQAAFREEKDLSDRKVIALRSHQLFAAFWSYCRLQLNRVTPDGRRALSVFCGPNAAALDLESGGEIATFIDQKWTSLPRSLRFKCKPNCR